MTGLSKVLGSQRTHLLVCAIGGILCFLPIINNDESFLGNSQYAKTIADDYLGELSATIVVALLAPTTINRFIDVCIHYFYRTKANNSINSSFLQKEEMLMILVGLLVPPIVLFSTKYRLRQGLLSLADMTYRNICARQFRNTLVIGVIVTSLSRHNNSAFPKLLTTFILALYSATPAITCHVQNLLAAHDPKVEMIQNARHVLLYISVAIFYSMCAVWLHQKFTQMVRANPHLRALWRKLLSVTDDSQADSSFNQNEQDFSSSFEANRIESVAASARKRSVVHRVVEKKMEFNHQSNTEKDEKYDDIYMAVIILCITTVFVTLTVSGETLYYNSAVTFTSDMAFALFEIAFVILNMRLARLKVVSGLVRTGI